MSDARRHERVRSMYAHRAGALEDFAKELLGQGGEATKALEAFGAAMKLAKVEAER